MIEERHIWRVWSRALHRWGLNTFAARMIEATSPLHILGAQLVYVGQPLLSLFVPQEHTRTLARTLEAPAEASAFARFLEEDPLP